jgi:hypothetical protein
MVKISPCGAPLPVLVLLLGVALPGLPAAGPVRLPGGVADPAGRMGFFPGTAGGIDAVDLKTGRSAWTSREASQPLLATRDQLAALAPDARTPSQVRIVLFDVASKGKVARRSSPVVFPEWVRIESGPGRQFTARPSLDGKTLVLRWHAKTWYAGGAPPPPEVVKKAKREASGVARIDLESGKVRLLKSANGTADVKLPGALKKVVSHSYWDGTDWSTKPLVSDDKVAALELVKAGGEEKLVLRQWSRTTGKSTGTIELARGKDLLTQLSLDGRYLLVQEEAARANGPKGRVFQLATGKDVGRLNQAASLAGVSVLGDRVYYLTGSPGGPPRPGQVPARYLKAAELKSGKVLWQHQIGGPRPMFLPP